MGFDPVRFGIYPQPMFQEEEANSIPQEYLGYVDEAVPDILANGQAVLRASLNWSELRTWAATQDTWWATRRLCTIPGTLAYCVSDSSKHLQFPRGGFVRGS